MRFALLFLLSMFVPLTTAQAELAPEEIMEAIEGRWALQPLNGNEEPACDTDYLTIWLREEYGELIYYSRWVGAGEQSPGVENIMRYRIGGVFEGVRLQYYDDDDGVESRLADNWILVMPDEETFFWRQPDWPPGYRTAVRKRCPPPALIS